MKKVEINRGTRKKSAENPGTANGHKKCETMKVENVKVEMDKIRRKFSRFDGHVNDIKHEMEDAKDILSQIKKEIAELDDYILAL